MYVSTFLKIFDLFKGTWIQADFQFGFKDDFGWTGDVQSFGKVSNLPKSIMCAEYAWTPCKQ